MDTAYETQTKRLVRAWAIGLDTSYIKPEEDIFYANPEEVVNFEEVCKKHNVENIEVRYRKPHLRRLKSNHVTVVVPCFFILNKKKLGIETVAESPEHKKIKAFMWEHFYNNNDLELQYSKYKKKGETINQIIQLKDLPIQYDSFSLKKEDFFEIGLTDTFNTRRVDLFLKFDKFDPLFGEGLVIEVQLSPQSEEKEKERTLDRALKGYSTIWVNKKHFKDHKAETLELNDLQLKINSWHSVINNDSDILCDKIYDKIKKYSREFDFKCSQTLSKISKSIFLQEGMLCPNCKVGQLLKRKGKESQFLGCSKFPECVQTYKITFEEGSKENE